MALGRISVFIDTSLRNACRQFAAENGNTESDVLRAALAIGLESLKHSDSPAGKRKALIDDVIGKLEDSIIEKEFWKARTTVCQLAIGGDPYPTFSSSKTQCMRKISRELSSSSTG